MSPVWFEGSVLTWIDDVDVVVVDASVLVELVIDGRHRAGADVLLDRYATPPALTIVSAAHGLIEALSALRRLVSLAEMDEHDGDAAVDWLRALDLVLDATSPRARRIWELRHTMSADDAAYAAGAEALGVPLLTVDDRLRRACAATGIEALDLVELGSS